MEQLYYLIYVELGYLNNSIEVELTNLKFNKDQLITDFNINPRDINMFRQTLDGLISSACDEFNSSPDNLISTLQSEFGNDLDTDLLNLQHASNEEIELYIKNDIFNNFGKPFDPDDILDY